MVDDILRSGIRNFPIPYAICSVNGQFAFFVQNVIRLCGRRKIRQNLCFVTPDYFPSRRLRKNITSLSPRSDDNEAEDNEVTKTTLTVNFDTKSIADYTHIVIGSR